MRDEKIKSFEDLIVYQKAYNLVLQTHKLTSTFPEKEKRELGYQLRRAAVKLGERIQAFPKKCIGFK